MAGYLVCRGMSFLEHVPYDDSYHFLATAVTLEYATVFTKEAATAMVASYRAQGERVEMIGDLQRPPRDPQIGIDAIRHVLARVHAA
jgi:hypothetical protein